MVGQVCVCVSKDGACVPSPTKTPLSSAIIHSPVVSARKSHKHV